MQALDELIKSLQSVHRFPDEQVDAFVAKLKYKKLSKKEFLLKPHQKCNFMAFIQKGSLRFYALNESDEHTLHFFTENAWLADYESFISQQPTKNYLQALEETEVLIITLEDIHLLMEHYMPFRNLASLINQWVIPSAHYVAIANASPDDRYKNLLDQYPEWINRFPQMYIASYLGMTKETFSRVKSRVR